MCALGLDCGTMFLVKGEIDDVVNETTFSVERNVFLQAATTSDTEETLKENNWSYVRHEDKYYILGEDAIRLKNLLTVSDKSEKEGIVATKIGDLRRPMQDGVLNTGEEKLSVAIIQKLIANLLGEPASNDEVLCFCVPGDPIDKRMTVLFHKTMLSNFLTGLGYKVECIPEALAIIFSERPVAEDPDNGETPFSGIAFSFGSGMTNICFAWKKLPLINFSVARCIPPGNKVIAQSGLLNIEDITTRDLVLNMSGNWSSVNETQSKDFHGYIYNFEAIGQGQWSTTGEHRLWIKPRDETDWQWINAEDVCVGDKVMQPWIDTYDTHHTIHWTLDNTKKYMNVDMFSHQYYLMGRFLGGGSVFKDMNLDRGIKIALNAHSPTKQDFLILIMESTFSKKVEVCEDDSVTLLKIHDSGLAKWFRRNCYRPILHGEGEGEGEGEDKVFPWDISHLKENYLRFLVAGLLDSDGYVDEGKNKIYLRITSHNLAQNFYLALMKIGLKPTISWRTINDFHEYNEKMVHGIREIFEVTAAGARCEEFIRWLNSSDLKVFFDKSETYGCNVAKITSITKEHYSGKVYDISVGDKYNSFCLPGCVVHNSGDWIDRESAKTVGIDTAAMTRYKEAHLNLGNVDYSDMRQAALDIFYQNMIENALTQFAAKFNELDNHIDSPLEIVVAGGTASVPGFIPKFESVLKRQDLPFKFKGVRLAENPLFAVANGCLIKALSIEKKALKKKD